MLKTEQDLASKVQEFYNRVRARPSESVGPELENLLASAKDTLGATFTARTSPVASITWMNRLILDPGVIQTQQQPVDIPYACEIVGLLPTILFVDDGVGLIEPPPEAIDVFLQVNRKDTLTARSDRNIPQDQNAQMVNLPSVSAEIANRLFALRLSESSDTVSIQFQWAVPLATVAAKGWGETQISLHWFVREIPGAR